MPYARIYPYSVCKYSAAAGGGREKLKIVYIFLMRRMKVSIYVNEKISKEINDTGRETGSSRGKVAWHVKVKTAFILRRMD